MSGSIHSKLSLFTKLMISIIMNHPHKVDLSIFGSQIMNTTELVYSQSIIGCTIGFVVLLTDFYSSIAISVV